MSNTRPRLVGLVLVLLALIRVPTAAAAQPDRSYVAYFYMDGRSVAPLGSYLVPVVFPLPEQALGMEPQRLPFQALCSKPPRGLTTALQVGCKVRSVRRDSDGTLVVDFATDAVFPRAGTTGDAMVVEQLAMTAARLTGVHRVSVTFRGQLARDLGSHGVGNPFAATGRSRMFLVTPPSGPGERPSLDSLLPTSAAVRNASVAMALPLLGLINKRLSEVGKTEYLARAVQAVVPSGDRTLWVKVTDHDGLYQIWWTGKDWQVDGL